MAATTTTAEPVRRPTRDSVREAVLAAAGELFLTSGYAGTSLDQVARHAGFTKGAVYSNFGGKPELFAQACRERFAEASAPLLEQVRAALDEHGRATLPAALGVALVDVVLQGEWHVVLAEFRSLARRDARLGELYDELARERETTLAEGLDLGALAGTSAAWRVTAAGLVLGQINVLALERLARGDGLPAAEIEARLVAQLEGLLP